MIVIRFLNAALFMLATALSVQSWELQEIDRQDTELARAVTADALERQRDWSRWIGEIGMKMGFDRKIFQGSVCFGVQTVVAIGGKNGESR